MAENNALSVAELVEATDLLLSAYPELAKDVEGSVSCLFSYQKRNAAAY